MDSHIFLIYVMKIEEIKNFLESNYPDWKLTYEDANQDFGRYVFEKKEGLCLDLEIFEGKIREIIIRHPYIGENDNNEILLSNERESYLFPRVFEMINKNVIDLKIELLEKYLIAIKKFRKNYEPSLTKYGFYAADDDLLTGDLVINKKLKYSFFYRLPKRYSFEFFYDLIEDSIFISGEFEEENDLFTYTPEEFNDFLFRKLSSDRRTEYLVKNDPRHTENTWYIINILMDHCLSYQNNRKPYNLKEADLIDINQIPKEYEPLYQNYQILKEKYEEFIKENSIEK